MGEINLPASVPILLNLVKDGGSSPAVKQAALHALQAYPDDVIGQQLAGAYPGFRDNVHVREAALALFASRVSWAKEFLEEVSETRTIHTDDVPLHLVKRFRLLGDAAVSNILDHFWPKSVTLSSAEKTQLNKR